MVAFVLLTESIMDECNVAQGQWVIISYSNCIIFYVLEKEDSQCGGKKDIQMLNEVK